MNIIEVYKRFPTQEDCIAYLEKVKWHGVPRCPYCKSDNSSDMKNEARYHCNNCNTSYSVTVGTIFHKSKVDLQKWFLAIAIILNAKKGLSARQLARDIGVNKNTAWYMGMRIRRAMIEDRKLLDGVVEIDETYVGGKPRKGGPPAKRGRGTSKTPVVGLAQRGGRICAKVQHKLDSRSLSALVKENVDIKAVTLMTDEYKGYVGLGRFANHQTVNHQVWYVCGNIHTNTIESFWSLLKRGIIGQYHKVSVRYLNRYITEFCYRQNNRDNPDLFGYTISRALGGNYG